MRKNILFTLFGLTFISCSVSNNLKSRGYGRMVKTPSKAVFDQNYRLYSDERGINITWEYEGEQPDATFVYYIDEENYLSKGTSWKDWSCSISDTPTSFTYNSNLVEGKRYLFIVESRNIYGQGSVEKTSTSPILETVYKPSFDIKSVYKNNNLNLELNPHGYQSLLNPNETIYAPSFYIGESNSDIYTASVNKDYKTGEYVWNNDGEALDAGMTYSYSIKMDVPDCMYSKERAYTFKADDDWTPKTAENLQASKNDKDRITITWDMPNITPALTDFDYDTQYRFDILRGVLNNGVIDWEKDPIVNYSNESVLDSGSLIIKINDNGSSYSCSYCDSTVLPNIEYVYKVISYHKIKNISTDEIMYYQENDNKNQTTSSWCFSKPVNIKSSYNKEKKALSDDKTKAIHKAIVEWDVPNYKEGSTFTLIRFGGENPEPNGKPVLEEKCPNIEDNFSSLVDDDGNTHFTFEDTVELSAEPLEDGAVDDYNSQNYTYKIIYKDGLIENSNQTTTPWSTSPSLIATFARNLTVEDGLADRIILKWDSKIEDKEDADRSNLSYKVYRSELPSAYNEDTDLLATLSADDTDTEMEYVDNNNLKIGKNYYYFLVASYSGFKKSTRLSTTASSSLMGKVDSRYLSASKAESFDTIKLEWKPVENAESYVIYKKGPSDSDFLQLPRIESDAQSETISYDFTISTLSDSGKDYEFKISPVDRNNTVGLESDKVSGYTFGLGNFELNGSVNTDGDKIVFTGTKVRGATSYDFQFYYKQDGELKPLLNKVVSSSDKRQTYFSYDDTNENMFHIELPSLLAINKSLSDEELTDPLSREYYCLVYPRKDDIGKIEQYNGALVTTNYVDDLNSRCCKKGNWLLSPTGVVATKLKYNNKIAVAWNKVSGVDSYNVYFKDYDGSDGYKKLQEGITDNKCDINLASIYGNGVLDESNLSELNKNKVFKFLVTSKKGSVESNSAEFFENGIITSKDDSRVGSFLFAPSDIIVSSFGDSSKGLLKVTFSKRYGVTKYGFKYASADGGDLVVDIADGKQKSSAEGLKNIGDYWIEEATGKVSVIVNSLKFKDLNFGIAAYVNSQSSEDKSIDVFKYAGNMNIRAIDIIYIANTVMSDFLTKANTTAGGDWWQGFASGGWYSEEEHKVDGTDSVIQVGVGAATTSNDQKNKTYFRLENYLYNGVYISSEGNIKYSAKNGGSAGYLGNDPLDYIGINGTGKVKVTLPFGFGTATVDYKNIYVSNTSGSGTYEVSWLNPKDSSNRIENVSVTQAELNADSLGTKAAILL